MGRAPCCQKVGLNRGPWTREEDLRLTQYIQTHGDGSWRTLPKAAGLLRCGKSCRLRWINYLRPDLKRGNITEEEDRLIIKLHGILGNRWSMIAARLPGRTDNEIKNYWNTHLKKKLRNMGIDPQTHQPLHKFSSTALSFRAKPLSIDSAHCLSLPPPPPPPPPPTSSSSSYAPPSPVTVLSRFRTSSDMEMQNQSFMVDSQFMQAENSDSKWGIASTQNICGDLFTLLSDIIHPAPAADSTHDLQQLYSNMGLEEKVKTETPASLLSLLESDFMWDMESIQPFEAISTPTGTLHNSSSSSPNLWGYAGIASQ